MSLAIIGGIEWTRTTTSNKDDSLANCLNNHYHTIPFSNYQNLILSKVSSLNNLEQPHRNETSLHACYASDIRQPHQSLLIKYHIKFR